MGRRATALAAAGLVMTLGSATRGVSSDANDMVRAYYAAISCEKYLRSNLQSQEVYKLWVEDYIVHFSEAAPDTHDVLELTDIDGMMTEIAENCRTRPSARFSEVVAVTTYAYYAIHRAERAKPQSVGGQEHP